MTLIYSKDVIGAELSAAELAQHVAFRGTDAECEAWLASAGIDRPDFVLDWQSDPCGNDAAHLPEATAILCIEWSWDEGDTDDCRTLVAGTRLPWRERIGGTDQWLETSYSEDQAVAYLRSILSNDELRLYRLDGGEGSSTVYAEMQVIPLTDCRYF